jgi:putative acetyltransferase
MYRIREATHLDREDIRKVHLSAFPEGERQIVAALAVDLLSEASSPETMALVAETDGAVVGHIVFSPVTVEHNADWKGYILAPLGVKPEFQRRRLGSELIKSGKKRLSESGANVLFVYGDPKYYGKFGFTSDIASRYLPPYELEYPFGWHDEGSTESRLALSCVASLRDPRLW